MTCEEQTAYLRVKRSNDMYIGQQVEIAEEAIARKLAEQNTLE